jgi:hypothetical protein
LCILLPQRATGTGHVNKLYLHRSS